MKNWIAPDMPELQKRWAQLVLSQFELSGMRVRYDATAKQFTFTQDRRVVPLPEVLIKENRWSDVRHLFRAILSKAPAIWNHGSANVWGDEEAVDSNERE
jgi:hypothetical protein